MISPFQVGAFEKLLPQVRWRSNDDKRLQVTACCGRDDPEQQESGRREVRKVRRTSDDAS
jgi:hypothetical protein